MQTQTKMSPSEYIESLNLEYSAEFVPESKSTNLDDWNNHGLHWNITISKGNQRIKTPYFQGIAHIPCYKPHDKSMNHALMVNHAVETGKYYNPDKRMVPKKIQHPELTDVMYSLIMDADAINYSDFQEWADNFGLDSDSRKAEKTYNTCIKIGLTLRAMLGDEVLDQLNEVFQDY